MALVDQSQGRITRNCHLRKRFFCVLVVLLTAGLGAFGPKLLTPDVEFTIGTIYPQYYSPNPERRLKAMQEGIEIDEEARSRNKAMWGSDEISNEVNERVILTP